MTAPINPENWTDRQWSMRAVELSIAADANAAKALAEIRELTELVADLAQQLNQTNAMVEDLAVMVIQMSEGR